MLARALVAEARRRGWAVLALSRAQADVCDRAAVDHWVRAYAPEAIFNCAAYTRVDDCESDAARCDAVNGEAVAHLAAAAAARRALLVHVSSDYVFDGSASEPYVESHRPAPLSAYGRAKLLGEERALAYDGALVVRTSWLFGADGPSFVATMVRLMETGKVPLRVVDDQVGCPTYVPFLARALCELARAGARGVVHYRNREPVSWFAFAREIAGQWDRAVDVLPVTTAEFPRPAPRPAYSVLAVDRCEEILGRRVEHWGWGLSELMTGLRQQRGARRVASPAGGS